MLYPTYSRTIKRKGFPGGSLFLLWNQQAGTLRRPAFQNLCARCASFSGYFCCSATSTLIHRWQSKRTVHYWPRLIPPACDIALQGRACHIQRAFLIENPKFTPVTAPDELPKLTIKPRVAGNPATVPRCLCPRNRTPPHFLATGDLF